MENVYYNELEARDFLASYGVPMVKGVSVHTEAEVVEAVKTLTFPVAMKVLSPDILHKTEAGCVFLGVKNEMEAIQAFRQIKENAKANQPNAKIDGILIQQMAVKGLEVIVGMKKDPQFGPVLIVGSGGIYVEVYKDASLRLLPITETDGLDMLAETKLYQIIQGARGTVYDQKTLLSVLINISRLAEQNPQIEEIDINPLFLYEQGAVGVDALVKGPRQIKE